MADTRLGKIGITVKEPYNPENPASYEVLDYVLYPVSVGGDGCGYIALKDNIGVTPGSDDTVWAKASQAGLSIYDLAVKYHHFEGTEEEFEAQYQAVLQAARDAAAGASAVEAQVEAAETARVAAETGRADAESARQSAEASRASAETARGTAEAARQSAESGRASAETARVTAEQGRASAESDRVSAEAARAAAETDRVSDFSALKTDMETAIGQADAATAAAVATNNQIQTAEASRVSAEQGRVSAEAARASAESARATAESGRATAETARVTAEEQRATAEGQRVTAENARVSAESSRDTAESARVTAEAARVSAETARESQASSDHTRAESDHAIASEDHATLDEKIAHKADIDGYYGGMTVGTAENLVGRGTTEAEYVNRRTSAGTADIGSGSAAITRIKGRSVVWNQLVQNCFTKREVYGITRTKVNNYTVHYSGTSTSSSGFTGTDTIINVINGHKYYAAANGAPSNTYLRGGTGLPVNQNVQKIVLQATANSAQSSLGLYISSGISIDNDVSFVLIDLTLLGIDNLTTVEEVEAWLTQNIGPLDYYAYNPGEVINNAAEGIKTRGFNLFNYATGKAYLPGKYSDYPYEYEICGTFTSISFTDVNGNTSVPELHEGKFFNVDAPGELTVVGGNNTDTLVHLVWSGWRNEGEPDYVYEPYWENTLNLGLTQLTGKLNGEGTSVVVFPHGLAKVGDVQDEIVGNRAIKRVGVVDLGTLNYTFSYNAFNAIISQLTGRNALLCGKYPTSSENGIPDDGYIGNALGAGVHTLWVKDSAYSDAASFKAAMSGVLLYYKRATPEEYILDNPPQFNYRVDDFSTEETVPSYDPANVIAPLAYDVQYAMNAVDAIRRLPDNYVERNDVKQVPGDSEKFVLSQKAVNDNYAKKVGVEDNLTVGLAKNIEGNATSGGYPFTFVKISGTDGLAKINDVRGNSLVWNQLVEGNVADGVAGWTAFRSTASVADGIATITPSVTDDNCGYATPVTSNIKWVENHKYLLFAIVKASSTNRLLFTVYNGGIPVTSDKYGTDSWMSLQVIFSASSLMAAWNIRVAIVQATDANETPFYVKSIQCIDLTLMFGAGNEPSTVEEFEALFPLPYYAYNAGTLISNKTEQVKVVGFNQWDEDWENGRIAANDGQNVSGNNYIRTKGYIPIFPNTSYYVRSSSSVVCYRRFYDADKIYLGESKVIETNTNATFTTPKGAYFVRFYLASNYGSTYNHDICINLSDPAKNGTYEPYKTNTIELNLPTLTGKVNGEGESVVIASDGLKSAGSVYDEGIVENGYLTKIVKRIGTVDLGSLTWSKGAGPRIVSSSLQGVSKVYGNNTIPNAICEKYLVANTSTNFDNAQGVFSLSGIGPLLIIADSAYTDAATFKTAMSGVMLNYELATPVTYVLDTPIPATFQSYKGGTLKQIPENGSAPTTAPCAFSVTYAIDAASLLTGLPQNYVSKESLQAMLTAMQSAGLFSAYTMTFNSSTGKYEFTFTPNA